jgi:hypothetical protein
MSRAILAKSSEQSAMIPAAQIEEARKWEIWLTSEEDAVAVAVVIVEQRMLEKVIKGRPTTLIYTSTVPSPKRCLFQPVSARKYLG